MGMTEIPVIAPKMTSGVKRTTFSEYKDIWEQANKSKSSLPMSAKSEVKYSKPSREKIDKIISNLYSKKNASYDVLNEYRNSISWDFKSESLNKLMK